MGRLVRCGALSVAAASALLVWACGGGGYGGGGTEPPTTGTVAGQVTVGGSPRAGVVTHIRLLGAETDARPAQVTSGTGSYTFTLVPPEEYRVFADLTDTLTADPGPAEDTVTVVAGEVATATTLRLRLLSGSVQGVVTDDVGSGLVGRSVFLRRQGSTSERSATSGGDGSYAFPTVAVGTYFLRVATVCGEPVARTDTLAVQDRTPSEADTIPVTPRPSGMLLSCDVQPIFLRSCGFAGCHGGGVPQEGLDLSSAARTLATAVDQVSTQRPPLRRIKPFFAAQDSSYLVCKIEAMCPNRLLARMPKSGTLLSSAQIDTIKGWIAAGALNN